MDMLLVGRFFVGIAFAASVAPKLIHPYRFQRTVRSYGLMAKRLTWPVSVAVLAAEGLVAAMLLGGWRPRATAMGCIFLLSLYSGAIVATLARGRVIDCGCGTFSFERSIRPSLLLRNGALAGLVLALALKPPARLETLAAQSGSPNDVLAPALTALALWMAVAVAGTIIAVSAVTSRMSHSLDVVNEP